MKEEDILKWLFLDFDYQEIRKIIPTILEAIKSVRGIDNNYDSTNEIQKKSVELLGTILYEIKKTNMLLEHLVGSSNLEKKLPTINNDFLNKNLIIVGQNKNNTLDFINMLASKTKSEVRYFEGTTKSDFAATLTALDDNDYIIIENSYLFNNREIYDIAVNAINNNTMQLTVGHDELKKKITYPLKHINYIVTADYLEMIGSEIRLAIKTVL